MGDTKESVNFEIKANNDELIQKIKESRQAIVDSTKIAEEQIKRVQATATQAEVDVKSLFSTKEALTFGDSVAASSDMMLESLEKVGRMISELISTFGGYKTALMSVSALQSVSGEDKQVSMKERLSETAKQYTADLLVETAYTVLNSAANTKNVTTTVELATANSALSGVTSGLFGVLVKHPYAALAIAVVGAVSATYIYCSAQEIAKRAQESYNKQLEETIQKQNQFASQTNQLVGVIGSDASSRLDQIRAFKELQAMYPHLLKNYSLEQLQMMDKIELQKLLNAERDKVTVNKENESYAKAQQQLEKAKKARDAYLSSGSEISFLWIEKLDADIKESEEVVKSWAEKIAKTKQDLADARPLDVRIIDLKGNIDLLEQQYAEIQRLQAEAQKNNPLMPNIYDAMLESTSKEIAGKKEVLGGMEAVEEAEKAKAERQKREEQIKAAKEAAERKKQVMANAAKEEQAATEQFGRALADSKRDLAQADIDSMDEGADKELKKIEATYARKKEATLKWEAEQKELVLAANKARFIAQGGDEKNYKPEKLDNQAATDTNLIAEQAKNVQSANDAEQKNATKELFENLKTQWEAWATDYEKIQQKINSITAKASEDKKTIMLAQSEGKLTEEEAKTATAKVDKGAAKQVSALKADKVKFSDNWEQLFRDAEVLSRADIKVLIENVNKEIDTAELSAMDTEALRTELDKLKTYTEFKSPFGKWVQGLKAVKIASEEVLKAQEELANAKTPEEKSAAQVKVGAAQKREEKAKESTADSASKSIKDVSAVAGSVTELLSTFGVESPAVDGVVSALGSLASIDFTNPISIITGGLGAISSLLSGIFGESDKKKEKKIQGIQREVEKLDKAYEELGEKIDDSFSYDAAEMIAQQEMALENQNELIRQQMELEKSKKNSDDGKVQAYQESIDANNKKIEEGRKAAEDAIFGESIESAIDNFASAYMNAWASGEDRAKSQKDVVKGMIRGIIQEMVKSNIGKTIQEVRDKIEAAMADGFISEREQAEIDAAAKKAYDENEAYTKPLEKWLVDEPEEEEREAVKRGIATASQESVDENNGRLTAMQSMLFDIKNNQYQMLELQRQNLPSLQNLSQLSNLSIIAENTAYCRRLEGIDNNINSLKGAVDSMMVHGLKINKS